MEIDLKKIGARIRRSRKSQGLSQEELAERCSCSSVFISHVELGRSSPSFALFLEICHALGITPDSLLLDVKELFSKEYTQGALSDKLSKLSYDDLEVVSGIVDVFIDRRK